MTGMRSRQEVEARLERLSDQMEIAQLRHRNAILMCASVKDIHEAETQVELLSHVIRALNWALGKEWVTEF